MQTFICNQPDTKSTVASPTWSELSVATLTFVDLSTQTPTILCSNMHFRHLTCQFATDQTRVATAKSHTFCGETYLPDSTRMWALHIITSTDYWVYGYIPGVSVTTCRINNFKFFLSWSYTNIFNKNHIVINQGIKLKLTHLAESQKIVIPKNVHFESLILQGKLKVDSAREQRAHVKSFAHNLWLLKRLFFSCCKLFPTLKWNQEFYFSHANSFSLQQATQHHKNIMFLYITFLWTLITNPALPSPFTDQMLHRWDLKTLTSQDSNRQTDKFQYIH